MLLYYSDSFYALQSFSEIRQQLFLTKLQIIVHCCVKELLKQTFEHIYSLLVNNWKCLSGLLILFGY